MLNDNSLISNYSSCYAKVFVGGNEVDSYRARNITSIEISETISGSDLCTLKISDTDGSYIDDDIFVEDVPICVELSDSATGVIHAFNGYIAAIDVGFDTMISMTITCMDNSYLLSRKKRSNTWDNVSSRSIVSSIVEGYGMTLEDSVFSSFNTQETLSQSDQTDLDFIESLLSNESVPCYFKVKDLNKVVYDSINFKSPAFISINYRVQPYEVISMSLNIDRAQLLESEESSDIEVEDNRIVMARSDIFETSPITSGLKAIVSSTPVNTGYTGIKESSNNFSNNAVLSEAQRKMMDAELMTITGDLKVLVTPDTNNVFIGDVINIYGIGIYLSGSYLVTDISRTVDSSGYSLSFSVSKTGFGEATFVSDGDTAQIGNAETEEGTITAMGETTLTLDDYTRTMSSALEDYYTKMYANMLSTKGYIATYTIKYSSDGTLTSGSGAVTYGNVADAVENALNTYKYMTMREGNNTLDELIQGNIRADSGHLAGVTIPSSYALGFCYTTPGMTLQSLAKALSASNHAYISDREHKQTIINNVDGTRSVSLTKYSEIAKMIIYGNYHVFEDRIPNFDKTRLEFFRDIYYGVQGISDEVAEQSSLIMAAQANTKVINEYLGYFYQAYYNPEPKPFCSYSDEVLPSGTKIDLQIFKGAPSIPLNTSGILSPLSYNGLTDEEIQAWEDMFK